MPSGAHIDVDYYYWYYYNYYYNGWRWYPSLQVCGYMNINVYSPLYDYSAAPSTGLCGNYDFNFGDDYNTFYTNFWCTGECERYRLVTTLQCTS